MIMIIRGRKTIEKFKTQNPLSRTPLNRWIDITAQANWKDLDELKATFPSCDYVPPYVVFNIGGNNYRMIAIVAFSKSEVLVVKLMTHNQYNRWKP